MFGLTFEKLLLIAIIAAFLIGPTRLPDAAAKLGQFIRAAKGWANQGKDRLKGELGDDFDEVDWKKLDPRQYDPRKIIRSALMDSDDSSATPARGTSLSGTSSSSASSLPGSAPSGIARSPFVPPVPAIVSKKVESSHAQ